MVFSKKVNGATIKLVKGDVTDLEIEAFVFYAQDNLELGSGFGTSIASRGGLSVKTELEEIGSVEPQHAVISKAGEMKADFIVHANGPKFQDDGCEEKLRQTMINTLKAVEEKGIKRIAFPGMGTGFYGIPKPVSAKIMRETIEKHLANSTAIEEVVLCLMENREFIAFEEEFKK